MKDSSMMGPGSGGSTALGKASRPPVRSSSREPRYRTVQACFRFNPANLVKPLPSLPSGPQESADARKSGRGVLAQRGRRTETDGCGTVGRVCVALFLAPGIWHQARLGGVTSLVFRLWRS